MPVGCFLLNRTDPHDSLRVTPVNASRGRWACFRFQSNPTLTFSPRQ